MRRTGMKFIGMLAVFAVVTGFGGLLTAEENGKTVGTNIGQYAPDFEVYTLQGEKISLGDYKGKPVFVNFWAWWCPPCIREAEILMELAKKYEGRIEFAFVGINLFYRDKKPLDPKEFEQGFKPGLERFKEGLRKARLVRPDSTIIKNRPDRLPEFTARNQEVLDYYLTSRTSLFDFRGYWERQFRAKTNERYGIPVTYLINPDGKIALDIHPNDQHWDKNDDILEDFIAGRDLSKYVSRFPIPEHHQRKPDTKAEK